MTLKITDKTNKPNDELHKPLKNTISSEKKHILEYIRSCFLKTKDLDLKYDLGKCIEILEGKENQILLDMKTCLYDVLTEKEKLFKENCDLISEIAELREQLLKHK